MDLLSCVSEERRVGEGAGLQELSRLSYTRRYIGFADCVTPDPPGGSGVLGPGRILELTNRFEYTKLHEPKR
jgi:hypothetical protein